MSSKRALRRASCGHKRAYATEAEAVSAAGFLRKRASVLVGNTWRTCAYHCGHCGKWHAGHAKHNERPKRRQDFET